jgi:putative membrane protein
VTSEPRGDWRTAGTDPDARFSLANERTFLAWIRTSLALLAGALAVAQFVDPFLVRGARTVLATILALLGLALPIWAYRRWRGVEQAMRLGRGLPYTRALLVVSAVLGVVGVLVLVASLEAGG